jgi:hypothetical protein
LKEAKTIAVEPQQFNQVTAFSSEHEHMPREWCLLEHCLNDGRESLKTAAQISESSGNPDASARLEINQRRRLPNTVRTSSGSTPASTLTSARPGNSMWMDADGGAGAGVGATSDTMTLLDSAATVTGKSRVRDCLAAQPVPFRYSYRHWKTWLALTPFSRATRAIDAPGTSVASTTRRFSSAVRWTRFVAPLPAT